MNGELMPPAAPFLEDLVTASARLLIKLPSLMVVGFASDRHFYTASFFMAFSILRFMAS